MKKSLAVAAISLFCGATLITSAQTTSALQKEKKEINKEKHAIRKEERNIKEGEVSYQTKQHFLSDFPNAGNVSYARHQNIDEVHFTLNAVPEKAYYDADAKLIGTVFQKNVTDLPATAVNNIKKNYKDYTVTRVIMFDDNENNESDMWLYGQQFADADNYFVELAKGPKKEVVKVNLDGEVSFFSAMK